MFFLLQKPHKPFPAFATWRTPSRASRFRMRGTSCDPMGRVRQKLGLYFSLLLCYSPITQPMIWLILSFLWNGAGVFSSWYCQTLAWYEAYSKVRRVAIKMMISYLKRTRRNCGLLFVHFQRWWSYCTGWSLPNVGLHYKTIQHGVRIHGRWDNFILVRDTCVLN